MIAHYLNIEAKHRQIAPSLASLADFSVSQGNPVDASIVLSQPNISLYCLDDATRRAIFVVLPSDVDLATAPFVYQTQYEQAQSLLAMPYDSFRELAHKLPEVRNLILIFSSGRSGSTLVSHVLNQLDEVLSLSEPDVASQFVHLRVVDGTRDTELRDLLDCTMRMLFKPSAFKTPTTYAIKFRTEATQVMDLFHATFPQAKNLFIYRDAFGFIASFCRIFRVVGLPEAMPLNDYVAMFSQVMNDDFAKLTIYLEPGATQISAVQQLTLWWQRIIEWYLAQYTRGIPVLAVRYADLNAAHEPVVRAIFNYCGLPTERVGDTLSVFSRDSQERAALARVNPGEGNSIRLTEGQIDEIMTILRRHPVVNAADFVVPGTLQL